MGVLLRIFYKCLVFINIFKIALPLANVYLLVFLLKTNNMPLVYNRSDQPSADSPPLDWKAIRQMEIDYWKTLRAETMTPQQILDYFRWSNHTACNIYNYFGGVEVGDDINYAKGVDGQYPVCLDQAVRPSLSKPRCLVYSIGINDNWSFDEAMERHGCEIFAFDPSINKSNHKHSAHIYFYNLGLADRDKVDSKSGWMLKTLDSIYRMLIPRHGEKIID